MDIKGIQKTSLIDFPEKIASVIFVGGCNFRCHYCHNPELIENNLENINENELLEYVDKRKKYVDALVITGGEPTLQKDLIDFIKKVKEIGLSVKLDTNGSKPEVIKELIEKKLIDYIAMDVKAPFGKYYEIVQNKIDIEKIKESIKIIKGSGIDYEFRTTLLPKLLSKEDIKEICNDIGKSKKYCLQQFRNNKTLNKNYREESSYSKEDILEIKEEIKNNFERCEVRGV